MGWSRAGSKPRAPEPLGGGGRGAAICCRRRWPAAASPTCTSPSFTRWRPTPACPGYRLLRRATISSRSSSPRPVRQSRPSGRRQVEQGAGRRRAERAAAPRRADAPTEEVDWRARRRCRSATGSCASAGSRPLRRGRLHLAPHRSGAASCAAATRSRGPARAPRRGERYRALVHVDKVNGAEATEEDGRPEFDELTPVAPSRRIALDPDPGDCSIRAVDLLVPLAERSARARRPRAPRSGRRRCCASSPARSRPTSGAVADRAARRRASRGGDAWREALPGAEIAAATADMQPRGAGARRRDGARRAPSAAPRAATTSSLIVDSLSRLALAKRRRRAVEGAVRRRARARRGGRRLADRGRDRARGVGPTTTTPSPRSRRPRTR